MLRCGNVGCIQHSKRLYACCTSEHLCVVTAPGQQPLQHSARPLAVVDREAILAAVQTLLPRERSCGRAVYAGGLEARP